MINIQNFQSNLLKIDKKPYKDFDIFYIGYITINPLYLLMGPATGYFTEKNGEKYLILDTINKYEEVFSGIKSELETINDGEKMYYEKHYGKAEVNIDDNIPLNKKLKFPTLTIIIRCVFQSGKKLCRQVYLDECLYEL